MLLSNFWDRTDRARLSVAVVACVILAGVILSGCATFDVQAEKLVHQSIVTSEQLHNAGVLKDADFKAVSTDLYRVSVAGDKFTAVYRAGTAKPTDYSVFLKAVDDALSSIKKTGQGGAIGSIIDNITALETKAKSLAAKVGVRL